MNARPAEASAVGRISELLMVLRVSNPVERPIIDGMVPEVPVRIAVLLSASTQPLPLVLDVRDQLVEPLRSVGQLDDLRVQVVHVLLRDRG